MIFYFSATGNSKFAAENIAERTGTETVSITDCLKNNRFDFESNEIVGFVTPTYSWGLPVTVVDFISRLNLKSNNPYVFTVATCGTLTGGASRMLRNLLKEKGITVTAQFYVRMPDTWTPVFDLSDKEKVRKTNDKAGIKIFKIANQVHRRIRGNRDYGRMPFADLFYKDYEEMRKTDRLSVNDNCIGCGLCEKLCPVEAIEIQNGKPVWIKEKCAMCLGCLHHCPEFAIQRGAKTALHGQYVHK
jgi:ferredoxin